MKKIIKSMISILIIFTLCTINLFADNDRIINYIVDNNLYTIGLSEDGAIKDLRNDKNLKINNQYNVVELAGGNNHIVLLKKDGTVWSFGRNNFGQLGDGTNKDSNIPVKVKGLEDIIQIDCGEDYNLALKKDGTVWSFGRNNFGQLGDGTNKDSNIPVKVRGLEDVIQIGCGEDYNLALKKDGTIWSFGRNNLLQNSNIPNEITELKDVTSIRSNNDYNLAITKDNKLYIWGLKIDFNQKNPSRALYIPEKGIGFIKVLSVNEYTIGIDNSGKIWNIDNFTSGQFELTMQKDKPIEVKGIILD